MIEIRNKTSFIKRLDARLDELNKEKNRLRNKSANLMTSLDAEIQKITYTILKVEKALEELEYSKRNRLRVFLDWETAKLTEE